MPLLRTNKFYTPELLRANLDFIFVFGDNTKRVGKGGQAKIRNEANALGLVTKVAPGMEPSDFFLDDDLDNCSAFALDVVDVLIWSQTANLVIPFGDDNLVSLGTGLSELPTRAPKFYSVLNHVFPPTLPEAPLQ